MSNTNIPDSLTAWYTNQQSNNNQPQGSGILSSANPSTPSSIPGNGQQSTPSGLLSGATSNVPSSQATYTASTYQPSLLGKASQWNVTPNQTVAGQLSTDLNSSSPLMQQAQNTGAVNANARGLLNSSIGSQAAESAMISAATPIAQADASTNATAASYNANEANTFKQNNQAAQNTAAEQNATNINAANSTNAQNAFTANQNQYNAQVETNLAQINNNAQLTDSQLSNIQSLTQAYNNQISTIQNNQYMTQSAKDYYMNQLYAQYKGQVTMLSDIGSVQNVGDLLSQPATSTSEPYSGSSYGPPPAQNAAQSSSGGGSVICTRLYELGLMDECTYLIDSLFGDTQDVDFLEWYRKTAEPLVEAMHGNTLKSRVLIKMVAYFAGHWSKWMSCEIGFRKKSNLVGAAIYHSGRFMFNLSRGYRHVAC